MGQPSQIPEEHWTENKRQVDAAQRAVVQSDPWLAFAPSDGLTLNEDRIPFDAESQRIFGHRYAKAYMELMAGLQAAK